MLASQASPPRPYYAAGKPGWQTPFLSREQAENNSPSRREGQSAKWESAQRYVWHVFTKKMCQELKLPPGVMQAADLYTLRFFSRRSYSRNDKILVAATSVFVAAKAMESPRNLKDVAYVWLKLKWQNKPNELKQLEAKTTAVLQATQAEDCILRMERALLYTLSFQVHVVVPYNDLYYGMAKLGYEQGKQMSGYDPNGPLAKLPFDTQKHFVGVATNFANDSCWSQVALCYPVEKIAAACLHMTGDITKIPLVFSDNRTFEEVFNIGPQDLKAISDWIHDSYNKKDATGATPAPAPAASVAAAAPGTSAPEHASKAQLPLPAADGSAAGPAGASKRASPPRTAVESAASLEDGELGEATGATQPAGPATVTQCTHACSVIVETVVQGQAAGTAASPSKGNHGNHCSSAEVNQQPQQQQEAQHACEPSQQQQQQQHAGGLPHIAAGADGHVQVADGCASRKRRADEDAGAGLSVQHEGKRMHMMEQQQMVEAQ